MTELQYLKSVCTLENTVLVNQERHKRQWKKYEQQFRRKKVGFFARKRDRQIVELCLQLTNM